MGVEYVTPEQDVRLGHAKRGTDEDRGELVNLDGDLGDRHLYPLGRSSACR